MFQHLFTYILVSLNTTALCLNGVLLGSPPLNFKKLVQQIVNQYKLLVVNYHFLNK